MLVPDLAAQRADVDRLRRVDDVRLGRHELEVAAEAGDALRVNLEHGVDLLDRPEEDVDRQQERDEFGHSRASHTRTR